LGRYGDASDAFARAAALAPENADLRTNLGIALQKAGRTEDAKKAFAEAERLRAASAGKQGSQVN
jgi:Flp pilus assembly protein TadD